MYIYSSNTRYTKLNYSNVKKKGIKNNIVKFENEYTKAMACRNSFKNKNGSK